MVASGRAVLKEPPGLWLVSTLTGAVRRIGKDAWGASVSPDNTWIAYTNGSRTEIWTAEADGSQPRRIIPPTAGERIVDIRWSPDGKRIGYVKLRPADDEAVLETCDRQGGDRRLVHSQRGLRAFCWLPGGALIFAAAEAPPDRASMNLWQLAMDARGGAAGRPARLTQMAGFAFAHPTASQDGKRIAFLRARYQSDVWVADLDKDAGLRNARRLTLDERVDWPTAWTHDGSAVLFHSDRNGTFDVYRQILTANYAEALLRDQNEKTWPQMSPDGNWILYRTWPERDPRSTRPIQIMRLPLAGGAPEAVLSTGGYFGPAPLTIERAAFVRREYPAFRCVHSGACVLLEATLSEFVVSSFDPISGAKRELARVSQDPLTMYIWDLSPDGTRVAIGEKGAGRGTIRIIRLNGAVTTELQVSGWNYLDSVDWTHDGNGLFVTSWSSLGSTILQVTMSGRVREIWKSTTWLQRVTPSPDGRRVVFAPLANDSNTWLIVRQ